MKKSDYVRKLKDISDKEKIEGFDSIYKSCLYYISEYKNTHEDKLSDLDNYLYEDLIERRKLYSQWIYYRLKKHLESRYYDIYRVVKVNEEFIRI